jgi:hypothetical protein
MLKASMSSLGTGIKRSILWDFPRASWQYDVMVAVILIFVFATPRDWFRDQPRASSVVMLPATHGGMQAYWIEPGLLDDVPEPQRPARAASLVRVRTQKPVHIVRLDPISDSEQELRGFIAYATP